MITTEQGVAVQLPDKQNQIFKSCYLSPSFVLVTTNECPQELFSRTVSLLDSDGLDWLVPLKTSTSRQLLRGHLDQVGRPLPTILLKKSASGHSSADSLHLRPGSIVNEIKSNHRLAAVVQKQIKTDNLPPPTGFHSLLVRVEQPLGILVDKTNGSKYSIFLFEGGFDFGEILQHTDPPIEGAINFHPQAWKIFCGIKDVLERIIPAARKEGLAMNDCDVHQVLYRVDKDVESLELMLIDSERFIMEN